MKNLKEDPWEKKDDAYTTDPLPTAEIVKDFFIDKLCPNCKSEISESWKEWKEEISIIFKSYAEKK